MIKPINGHVLIEPVKHDSFIPSQKETYQEVGVVIDMDEMLKSETYLPQWTGEGIERPPQIFKEGDRVFFDAWLGKKYPKPNSDDFYWLIRFEDIVAYEKQVPEQHV